MNFNSYEFVLFFLPVFLIGYFLLNKVNNSFYSKCYVLFMSIFFYGYRNINNLFIIFFYILVNYMFINKLYSNKKIYILNLTLNILFLLFCKIENLFSSYLFDQKLYFIFPLSVSFYLFSHIMIATEKYNGKIQTLSLFDYSIYILFFPKMIQGPLTEPSFLLEQLNNNNNKNINWDNILYGFILFIIGLAKKILLADIFASAVEWGWARLESIDTINAMIIILSYTLEIYFDFSGYSDMAQGISKMMNIEIPSNFDYPYGSYNISQFWKKWHISLSDFFKRYIYIPLGGNKKGKLKSYINTMIVFIVSGLWHGFNINYLVWGVLNGVLLIISKMISKTYNKLPKIIEWLLNFTIINALWIVFNSDSINSVFLIMKNILQFRFNKINEELIMCFSFSELDFVSKNIEFIRIFKSSRIYVFLYLSIGLFLSIFGNRYKHYLIKSNSKIKYCILLLLFLFSLLSLSNMNSFVYESF